MAAISLRTYAKHKGVSVEAVSQAIKAGRLKKSVTKGADGKPKIADADLADREWEANTDQSKPRNAITGDPKHRRAPGEPMKPMDDAERVPGATGPSYAQSRAIREAYMARLAKLDFDEKSGKLVNADEVKVASFNAARKARDSLLGIPDRIAPILAGMNNERDVHRVLSDEIRRVCSELAANLSSAHGA